MTVNADLFNALVRHQIGLTRLASGNAARLTKRLNTFDSKIVDIISKLSAKTTKRQLDKALADIRTVNKAAYADLEKAMAKTMTDVSKAEIDYQHKTVTKTLPADARKQIDLKKPKAKDIKSAVTNEPINGALLGEHIAGMEAGRYNRMRDAIRKEVGIGGDAVPDAIDAAIVGSAEAGFADGVLGVGRRSLDQVTRTIQNGVAQQAKGMFYGENDDVFDGVQWVSVLDNRTSTLCASLDGTVFGLDEGPRPPVHPNCRSDIIPIIKDWEALGLEDLGPGTRESMDGEVPETMTYETWLKGQSAKVQDDILGPTRGKMFRNDGVSLDRFVDQTGRRFTLDELGAFDEG